MKRIISTIVIATMILGLAPCSVRAEELTEEQILHETEAATNTDAYITDAVNVNVDTDNAEVIYDDVRKDEITAVYEGELDGEIPAGYYAEFEEDLTENNELLEDELTVGASGESDIVHVENYTYEIIPLLPPYNDYFYVKTDNPDPRYVRFVDKESVYYTEEDYDRENGPCAIRPSGVRFSDVAYEDYETGRVKGGYIFVRHHGYNMDGGSLVLQQGDRPYYRTKTSSSWYSETVPIYTDTKVTVNCPPVKSSIQYLIDNYTSPTDDLFTNLSKVQGALNSLSLYPKGVLDTSKPNESRPYPLLAVSPYYELGLNAHYDMYETGDSLLALAVHPYVLHSLTFPGTIATVAETLEPDCTVDSGSVHYMVTVEYNGEKHSYGGAGSGSTADIYSSCVEKLYKFDGSADDFAYNASIEKISEKYFEYQTATSTAMSKYISQIKGDEFDAKTNGGTWLRVGAEGSSIYGRTYAYVTSYGPDCGSFSIENTWVDGRYVSIYNCYTDAFEFGDTYEYGKDGIIDTSKSNILIRNMTFVDNSGATVTRDVYYRYDSDTDTWRAPNSYVGRNWYYSNMVLPDSMILTRDEVNQMVASGEIGGKVDMHPASGLIYDGTAEPGTPFQLSVNCQRSLHKFAEEKNPSKKFLYSEATCTEPAKYRKVCSECGVSTNEYYTYGTAKGHESKRTFVGGQYWEERCSVCNKLLSEGTMQLPTANGVYVTKMDRTGITAGLVTLENDKSQYEYSWYACKGSTGDWFEIQGWKEGYEWINWTPKEYGDYIIVGKVRIKGNDSTVDTGYINISYHPQIKGKCQMPYTGEGGGYLIGVESYENPNQSYQYEMLVLDCTLLAEGKDAWIYTTGKCLVASGNALWTVWQPKYGYYWTLFRIYDKDGNLLDEECYGFVNAY
ncbi:MAG: hypothetical protein NC240_04530 [Clostridium sp.]|nr:hypothetical protein [Clostridium sp.]